MIGHDLFWKSAFSRRRASAAIDQDGHVGARRLTIAGVG
jgi:hypothetical protein